MTIWKEKTRTNIEILDESWRYWCEFVVFNTKRYGNKYRLRCARSSAPALAIERALKT